MDTRHLKGLACAIPGNIYDDASTLLKPAPPILVYDARPPPSSRKNAVPSSSRRKPRDQREKHISGRVPKPRGESSGTQP